MIDLTPLEVRKKKGDFRRGLRGYDPPQVDDFLDIVADRLDTVVRENASFHERIARLEQQVTDYREREKALTEALVTAQEMREEMRAQSTREADLARRHAEQDAARIRAEAAQVREREEDTLRRLRARQQQFLNTYRAFLERELSELESVARGLELNGSLAEAEHVHRVSGGAATPSARAGGEPRAATAAVEPAAPAAPGGDRNAGADWETAAGPDEWATAPPPRPPERTAFAAGVAGASARAPQPVPQRSAPPAPEPGRPALSEWGTTPPAGSETARTPPRVAPGETTRAPQAPPSAPPAAATESRRPAQSTSARDASPADEAELILSDADVLSDPDLDADMDILFGGGAGTPQGSTDASSDVFSPGFGQSAHAHNSFGLDLVPEFDDFADFGNASPPGSSGGGPGADLSGQKSPAEEQKKPRRSHDADDDPEDLLSSLFGDDR